MSWKGTMSLLIIAIAALLFLFSSGRSHTRSPQEPLLDIHPERVNTITTREGGGEIVLTKKGGTWMVESPLLARADRADPSKIRSLLEQASGITSLDILHHSDLKGTVSLESLDLKNPKRSLSFFDGANKTVSFGAEGPAKGQLYARMGGDETVYLIPSGIVQLAFQSAEEFRDHRLTSLDADHLEEINLIKGAALQNLSLKKEGSDWHLTSPMSARGNEEAIKKWAGSLLSAKIAHWLPQESNPTACGIDAPVAVISARESGTTAPVTLTIGSVVPGSPDSLFVRCSDRPGICIVPGLDSALRVSPSALRSREPKQIRLDAVDRIEIHPAEQPGGSVSPMVVSRKKGSEDWEIIRGGSGIVQAPQMGAWFEKLQSLKALSFEPATPQKLESSGLIHPTIISLIAHLSENTAEEGAGDLALAEYSFGTPSAGVLALREGASSDLMILPESALELTKGPEAEVDASKR